VKIARTGKFFFHFFEFFLNTGGQQLSRLPGEAGAGFTGFESAWLEQNSRFFRQNDRTSKARYSGFTG
jgi:hypothetical protein